MNLYAKFAHMSMPRLHRRAKRERKIRAVFRQQTDGHVNFDLFRLIKPVPPGFELIGELNFPRRKSSIPSTAYAVKRIIERCHAPFSIPSSNLVQARERPNLNG